MLSIALCLALARDLAFEEVMVDQVIAMGPVNSLEAVLPARQARLLRLLSSPDYDVRQLASAELRRQGRDASLALAWGMRVRDPEIAATCARLRDELYVCGHCGGAGDCPVCAEHKASQRFDGEDEAGEWWPCPESCGWEGLCQGCRGTGHMLWDWKWEYGERVLVRRDVFAAAK